MLEFMLEFNQHFDHSKYSEYDHSGGPESAGGVALVAHAGAECAHGPGVGVLLRLLSALVHLLGPAPANDHLLPVCVPVKLHARFRAGDVVGLQRVIREPAEVLDTAVVTLQSRWERTNKYSKPMFLWKYL